MASDVVRPPQEEMTRFAISSNPQMHHVLQDFSEYLGVRILDLTGSYVVDHLITFDGLTIGGMKEILEPQRRVLGQYTEGKSGAVIYYRADQETSTALATVGKSLGECQMWAARIAVYRGLALDMEAERYKPEVV